MSWSTGWISLGGGGRSKARQPPTVSSLALRSLQMTSGLFNTGGAGDSFEFTGDTSTAQPGTSMSDKFAGHDDFLAQTLNDDDFDMDVFGDLGGGLDPLADASLDSFTDLSAFLSEENTFLDVMKTDEPASFADLNKDAGTGSTSLKRSFDEMEAGTSDLDNLAASVGLSASSSHDHDYSCKRPRTSTATEEPSDEVFLAPSLPSPSTSQVITSPVKEDKTRSRREKNNIASKRSREIRKQKFTNMESEAERLIADNARMEKRVAELEKLAKQMKEILVAKMAGK